MNAAKPILIAEDEPPIADLIRLTLESAGYPCAIARDGAEAADLIERQDFLLAVLDIMLPEINGYELLGYLQSTGTPALFVTAKTAVAYRVRGLRFGAEDYILKPFAPAELLARVEAVLRRTGRANVLLSAFGVVLDPGARQVTKDGAPVRLSRREFDLLEALLRNRGLVLYRDVLYERIWGPDAEADTRTLDLHIQRLRKKLGWRRQIRTVFRVGYMLQTDEGLAAEGAHAGRENRQNRRKEEL